MTFEEYLKEKKIDSVIFQEKETQLWETWKHEFEQMHPNSFTVQKLNLINPIRRKYPGKIELAQEITPSSMPQGTETPPPAKPKPVFRPKPKIG